jgi:predicted AAA+ superfamily ATPase
MSKLRNRGTSPLLFEALKYRFNRGRRSNLFFYRDGKGNEVDLILELGTGLFPIEIKAGATISSDYFKGLKSFEKVIARTRCRSS